MCTPSGGLPLAQISIRGCNIVLVVLGSLVVFSFSFKVNFSLRFLLFLRLFNHNFRLCSVFVVSRAFFCCRDPGLLSSFGPQASQCSSFSCCAVKAWGCVVFNSCGVWTQLLHGTWDPPGPGIEPVSPVLAGGFFTRSHRGSPMRFFVKFFVSKAWGEIHLTYNDPFY